MTEYYTEKRPLKVKQEDIRQTANQYPFSLTLRTKLQGCPLKTSLIRIFTVQEIIMPQSFEFNTEQTK